MGATFMQKRSAFKESSERRARAEQRKIKVSCCEAGAPQTLAL